MVPAWLQWLAEHGLLEEFIDMLAPTLEEHDHRSGVRGTIIGRDSWLTSQIEISALLGQPRFATVAVRGQRLSPSLVGVVRVA